MSRGLVMLMVTLCGCGLSSVVRPTPVGVLAVEASLGGPLVDVGVPAPLPLVAVGASLGVHERVAVSAHAHTALVSAPKTFGLDVGAHVLALRDAGARPSLTVTGRGYVFLDGVSAPVGIGELGLVAAWSAGARARPFIGFTAQYDGRARVLDVAPAVGAEVLFGRVWLQLELVWYAPTQKTSGSEVGWYGLGGQGALGFVLGGRFPAIGATK